MRRLAIIPNDPIDLYLSVRVRRELVEGVFQPGRILRRSLSRLSPYEQVDGRSVGVTVTADAPRASCRVGFAQLNIDVVRAYGGSHRCDIACGNKVERNARRSSPSTTPRPDMLHRLDARCRRRAVRVERSQDASWRRHVLSATDRLWILPNRVDFEVMRPRITRRRRLISMRSTRSSTESFTLAGGRGRRTSTT